MSTVSLFSATRIQALFNAPLANWLLSVHTAIQLLQCSAVKCVLNPTGTSSLPVSTQLSGCGRPTPVCLSFLSLPVAWGGALVVTGEGTRVSHCAQEVSLCQAAPPVKCCSMPHETTWQCSETVGPSPPQLHKTIQLLVPKIVPVVHVWMAFINSYWLITHTLLFCSCILLFALK